MDLSFKNIDLFGSNDCAQEVSKKAIENGYKKGLILFAKSKKVRVL
jgi:hypothetical protein